MILKFCIVIILYAAMNYINTDIIHIFSKVAMSIISNVATYPLHNAV